MVFIVIAAVEDEDYNTDERGYDGGYDGDDDGGENDDGESKSELVMMENWECVKRSS